MAGKQMVIFSGGSATNSLVDVFNDLLKGQRSLSYIIGISDNGGSSSEILRVFGGPGIGDVRSRLIRLVPDCPEDKDRSGTKGLLNYRLSRSKSEAKAEWLSIVEGTHELWTGISSEKRELIRSFLVFLHAELIKRGRPTNSFDFTSASIGNLFLTAARIFTGSFESAVYLFGSITGVRSEITRVIPAINSNFAHHIAAGLENGTVIVGQNQISHPSSIEAAPGPIYTTGYNTPLSGVSPPLSFPLSLSSAWPNFSPTTSLRISSQTSQAPHPVPTASEEHIEDATPPFSLLSLTTQNIHFQKFNEPPLYSRISRIWYINPYGHEIRPPANPKVIHALNEAETVIYSIGSLYTSLWPCLILRGVGNALLGNNGRKIRFKILILNGSLDRETCKSPPSPAKPYMATDFVEAIVKACLVSCIYSSSLLNSDPGYTLDSQSITKADIRREARKFITHLIYLEGEGVPEVDCGELKETFGIECVRVYGRRAPEGGGMWYDGRALGQALEAILGRSEDVGANGSEYDGGEEVYS